jgi:hypothetical protein
MSVPARRGDVDLEPVKPFTCEDCGKGFENIQGLSGHRLVHRPVAPCPECGQTFTTPSAQARHRNKEHGVPLKGGARGKASVGAVAVSEWTADDILESVISAMFPGGSLPNKAVMPLIRWREATRELITTLQTQT